MSELPTTKKSLGQHWLNDITTLESICSDAQVQPTDTVLEIGPGLGTLTDVLLARGARVIALEYDPHLVERLLKKYNNHSNQTISVEPGDVRSYDFANMPDTYKIVANIPYYLTANLLRKLTETPHMPARAALLMQKEVAERVAARPGQMSFISVAAQFYYEPSLGEQVPAYLFTPPPKVDSQVLILTKRPAPLFTDVDPTKFFRLVKAGFSERRKKLKSALSGGLQLGKDKTEHMIASAGINSDARAQELSMQQWHQLYQSYIR